MPQLAVRSKTSNRGVEQKGTMNDNVKTREVLEVVETEGLYLLRIDYEEGDIASAIGHVFWSNGLRQQGEVLTQVLATNDTLRTMWAAPSGSLWVASSNGSVGTTAMVRWPPPTSGADYLTLGPSPSWSVTDLPRVRATRLPPNVTALWGTADSDVYAGTYGGHIYRWDGTAWLQVFEGPGAGNGTIQAFGGAPNDVYAVGKEGTILHFDGRAWRRLRVPDPPNGHELFTGVLRAPDGDVLISSSGDRGRLLHGSVSGGLAEFGRYSIHLIDMAPLGDRVLFATGDGAAELIGRDVKMIKSNFRTASMSPGKRRVFFIEPAQEQPRFVEFDPAKADAPWWRMTY
jgi:hypothetical protein